MDFEWYSTVRYNKLLQTFKDASWRVETEISSICRHDEPLDFSVLCLNIFAGLFSRPSVRKLAKCQ